MYRACCLLVGLLVMALAPRAEAGAWPREKGTWFLSLKYTGFGDRAWTGGYLEYGLTEKLTFGIDGGHGAQSDNWFALVFLQRDLNPGGNLKVAGSLGLGQRGSDLGPMPLVRGRVMLGHGFTSPFGSGWAQAEAQWLWTPGTDWTATKLNLIAGVKPRPRTLAFVELETADYPGAPLTAVLVPTLVQRFGKVSVELGATLGVAGTRDRGLKLGMWLEF